MSDLFEELDADVNMEDEGQTDLEPEALDEQAEEQVEQNEQADESAEPVEPEASAEESEQSDEPAKPTNETVPLAAHLEERNKLKARIEQLEKAAEAAGAKAQDDLRRQIAEQIEQQRKQRAEQEQAEKEQAEAPDYLEDPKGYTDRSLESLQKKIDEQHQTLQQIEQQRAQQQAIQVISQTAAAHEQQFTQTTPDYPQALEFARAKFADALRLQNPGATDEQINAAVAREEVLMSHNVMQRGGNIAEFVYGFAKNYGYTAPAPEQKAEADAAGDELEKMRQSRQKAASMGGAGSGDNLAEGLDADEDEVEAALKQIFS